MSSSLTSDASSAVPMTPVTKAALPQWLEAHPDRREWLNVIGFKAEPNSFAFLPSSNGEPTRSRRRRRRRGDMGVCGSACIAA